MQKGFSTAVRMLQSSCSTLFVPGHALAAYLICTSHLVMVRSPFLCRGRAVALRTMGGCWSWSTMQSRSAPTSASLTLRTLQQVIADVLLWLLPGMRCMHRCSEGTCRSPDSHVELSTKAGPVCTLHLPHHVPSGLHGSWSDSVHVQPPAATPEHWQPSFSTIRH